MTERILIGAFTRGGADYPGYVNAARDGGEVLLTVRGDPPVTADGCHVCGFARDKGKPGRCTPGDAHCNNYCNMAPEKGPMAPAPLPFRGIRGPGETVTLRLGAAEWRALLAALSGGAA